MDADKEGVQPQVQEAAESGGKTRRSSLKGVLINVILPVLILDYCSKGSMEPWADFEVGRFWHLGPVWAMVLALLLPITYGLQELIRHKRVDLMSSVGLAGVLLTGVITILVVGEEGSIAASTPWLFACKEALIPLVLAAAVLVSRKSESPLLQTFLYNPDVFDVALIERRVKEAGNESAYGKLLGQATWILAGSLIVSSAANFCLALYFLMPVLLEPVALQQEQYNYAVGRITWWGFIVIGVPLMIALMAVMLRLIRRLGELTGLGRDRLLLR